MKTIKERAEAIANDVLRKVNKIAEEDGGFVAPQHDESVRNLIVASYIRGAEDQRGIDITAAVYWVAVDRHKFEKVCKDGVKRLIGWKESLVKRMGGES